MSVGNTREVMRRRVDGEMRDVFGINHKGIPECLLKPLPLKTAPVRKAMTEGSVEDRKDRRRSRWRSQSKLSGCVTNDVDWDGSLEFRSGKVDVEGSVSGKVQKMTFEADEESGMDVEKIEEALDLKHDASIEPASLEDIADETAEQETGSVEANSVSEDEQPTVGRLETASMDGSESLSSKEETLGAERASATDKASDWQSPNQNGPKSGAIICVPSRSEIQREASLHQQSGFKVVQPGKLNLTDDQADTPSNANQGERALSVMKAEECSKHNPVASKEQSDGDNDVTSTDKLERHTIDDNLSDVQVEDRPVQDPVLSRAISHEQDHQATENVLKTEASTTHFPVEEKECSHQDPVLSEERSQEQEDQTTDDNMEVEASEEKLSSVEREEMYSESNPVLFEEKLHRQDDRPTHPGSEMEAMLTEAIDAPFEETTQQDAPRSNAATQHDLSACEDASTVGDSGNTEAALCAIQSLKNDQEQPSIEDIPLKHSENERSIETLNAVENEIDVSPVTNGENLFPIEAGGSVERIPHWSEKKSDGQHDQTVHCRSRLESMKDRLSVIETEECSEDDAVLLKEDTDLHQEQGTNHEAVTEGVKENQPVVGTEGCPEEDLVLPTEISHQQDIGYQDLKMIETETTRENVLAVGREIMEEILSALEAEATDQSSLKTAPMEEKSLVVEIGEHLAVDKTEGFPGPDAILSSAHSVEQTVCIAPCTSKSEMLLMDSTNAFPVKTEASEITQSEHGMDDRIMVTIDCSMAENSKNEDDIQVSLSIVQAEEDASIIETIMTRSSRASSSTQVVPNDTFNNGESFTESGTAEEGEPVEERHRDQCCIQSKELDLDPHIEASKRDPCSEPEETPNAEGLTASRDRQPISSPTRIDDLEAGSDISKRPSHSAIETEERMDSQFPEQALSIVPSTADEDTDNRMESTVDEALQQNDAIDHRCENEHPSIDAVFPSEIDGDSTSASTDHTTKDEQDTSLETTVPGCHLHEAVDLEQETNINTPSTDRTQSNEIVLLTDTDPKDNPCENSGSMAMDIDKESRHSKLQAEAAMMKENAVYTSAILQAQFQHTEHLVELIKDQSSSRDDSNQETTTDVDKLIDLAKQLKENVENIYDQPPTSEEVHEFARYLGMDVEEDMELLYIAEWAMTAPLPTDWSVHLDAEGHEYFHHKPSKTSQYEHPMDQHYRRFYHQLKSIERGRHNGH